MTTCALANPACQKQPDERNLMTGGAPIQLIHCHTTVIIGDTLSHQIIIIIIVSGDVMIIIDHLCQITWCTVTPPSRYHRGWIIGYCIWIYICNCSCICICVSIPSVFVFHLNFIEDARNWPCQLRCIGGEFSVMEPRRPADEVGSKWRLFVDHLIIASSDHTVMIIILIINLLIIWWSGLMKLTFLLINCRL